MGYVSFHHWCRNCNRFCEFIFIVSTQIAWFRFIIIRIIVKLTFCCYKQTTLLKHALLDFKYCWRNGMLSR
jgi:hypothetical protein